MDIVLSSKAILLRSSGDICGECYTEWVQDIILDETIDLDAKTLCSGGPISAAFRKNN